MSWKTSTIDHDARIRMGLSMNDYVLLDHIYRTQTSPKYGGKNGGWCEITFDVISTFFGISKGGISGIFKKLTDAGLMEVSGKKRRATEKWFSHYESDVQKVNACSESEQGCSESEQHTILYNNKEKITPLPPAGELRQSSFPATAAATAAHLPTWPELLRRKSRPSKGFSAAMTPNPAGNDWERRLHVFDAVRRKYPGTKSGLSVEFDQFLARAHENKIQDIDAELRQMPYAVLYQIKWNEVKKDEGGFVPNWKNFSTWLSKMCWQSDMEAWKSRSEWFNQMCPENTKEAVEALKSILPCK